MTKWTAREMALQVIYQVNEEKAYANLALDKMMAKAPEMEGRDKALTTELVYGSSNIAAAWLGAQSLR